MTTHYTTITISLTISLSIPLTISLLSIILDAGGVKHDTDSRTERLRRQRSLELSTNFTTSPMRTSNFTPNSASLGAINGLLGTVNEGDTFAEVGTCFSLVRNVFEFEDRSGGGLSVFGTTVSHMTSLNKESIRRLRERAIWRSIDIYREL